MKLIVDVSDKAYNEYMNLATGRIPTYKACDIAWVLKHGIHLDKVKGEINRNVPISANTDYNEGYVQGRKDSIETINNIVGITEA